MVQEDEKKKKILFSWLIILLNSFSCVFYSHEHAWMFGYLLIGIVTEAYSLGKNFQMWKFFKSNFMTIFKSAIKNLKMIIFARNITGSELEVNRKWSFKLSSSRWVLILSMNVTCMQPWKTWTHTNIQNVKIFIIFVFYVSTFLYL